MPFGKPSFRVWLEPRDKLVDILGQSHSFLLFDSFFMSCFLLLLGYMGVLFFLGDVDVLFDVLKVVQICYFVRLLYAFE